MNDMATIKAGLLTMCFNDKSPDENLTKKYENTPKSYRSQKSKSERTATSKNSKNFYNHYQLHILVNCAKLHPSISNTCWEKSYFVPTRVTEYIITDFKYTHENSIVKIERSHTFKTISEKVHQNRKKFSQN